ncbi:MAG TPA: radical SAM protein [Anaeromyxobacteraceae bacterium]|nr:radical SAM protein [Anaeromyxobacteraceae bacterium]
MGTDTSLPRPGPPDPEPGYLRLHRSGELTERARQAVERLRSCDLCPRNCRVNRTISEKGAVCRTGRWAVVHAAFPHHGEERPIRGIGGSGTVFFSSCNLRCLYCQNWEISWKREGREVEAAELAGLMLGLQERGCENVNLVSPSHVVAQILEALDLAAGMGLRLPVVYNTGGYDARSALALLDGAVDVYMPDAKYADDRVAHRLSGVRDYVRVNRAALKEMHRQVGDLALDARGVAVRGLLVRHLVLPGGLAGTEAVMRFLARQVSPDTYVNVMDQYRPCHRAAEAPEIARAPTRAEIDAALAAARRAGIHRIDAG